MLRRGEPRSAGKESHDLLYLSECQKRGQTFLPLPSAIIFRASCRIRTNDPEITNHVLWPTELKRQVGKRSISRRYDLTTFAAVKPWRIRRELAV